MSGRDRADPPTADDVGVEVPGVWSDPLMNLSVGSALDAQTCLSEQEIALALEGRLTKVGRLRLTAHLARCPDCSEVVALAAQTLDELEPDVDLPADPKPGREALASLIDELSPEDQLLLRLRHEDGLSIGEVAQRLGRSQRSLYRRLAKIEKDLRARMTGLVARRHRGAQLIDPAGAKPIGIPQHPQAASSPSLASSTFTSDPSVPNRGHWPSASAALIPNLRSWTDRCRVSRLA